MAIDMLNYQRVESYYIDFSLDVALLVTTIASQLQITTTYVLFRAFGVPPLLASLPHWFHRAPQKVT